MEKFTKLQNRNNSSERKDDILFDGEHFKVIKFEDWSLLKDKDIAICIIYLVEKNEIILRHEYIPTYKYVDKQDFHLTLVGGSIENDETPEIAMIREIEEEAGIIIDSEYKLEPLKPLFISKGCVNKYHPFIIPLMENDYTETIAKGDGTKIEKISKSVRLDTKYIKAINSSDLITDYMLIKIKQYLNIL